METLANIIQNLNPPQRKAVETTDGALLVLAGAGTGNGTGTSYSLPVTRY